jgi:hypothetical protein
MCARILRDVGVSAYLAPKACGVSARTPPLAREQRPVERGESLQAVGKRQKTPQQTEGCALETRGGLLLETPLGVCTVEPVLPSTAYMLVDTAARDAELLRRIQCETVGARTRETTLSGS